MIPNTDLLYIFYYFLIYSLIGWCMEVCYAAYKEEKFVNKGFLNGPFCPIYGFGATLLVLVLEPLKNDPFLLFACAVFLTSALEYITGYVLEMSFHHTWWNYRNEPFNLHGRICLKFSILWGILAEIIVNLLHPLVQSILTQIPRRYLFPVFFLLALYFLIDFALAFTSILQLNARLKQLQLVSAEIKLKLEHLKEAAAEKREALEVHINELKIRYEHLLSRRVVGHSRLLHAFPNLKSLYFDMLLKEIKHKIELRRRHTKQ